MKINYFFPVFKKDNFKEYFLNFKKTSFFKKWKDYKTVFVCNIEDENNLKFLKEECLKNKQNKLIVLQEEFTYNDAFYVSIKDFDGDIVLLGDTKINKIDLVFEKCLEKYNKKASVVHVVKKRLKFKGFLYGLGKSIYNFFIKIFTNKTDKLNVISLGLIDKNIIDILKNLPNKCCFLKNTKDLLGFETRTVYIPPKTKTYKLNFRKKTWALIMFIFSCCLSLSLIILTILLNIFIRSNLYVYNILSILVIIISACLAIISLPKHIFDIRNFTSTNLNFNNLEEKEHQEELNNN